MRKKTFWISRDKDGWYNIAKEKMCKCGDTYREQDECFCGEKFEVVTKIKLRKGQQVKARLVIIKN